MDKFILGSGLIALVARKILGDEWKLIKFGRSRFYSVTPPLADNFIPVDTRVDEFLTGIALPPPIMYKRAFSIAGELIYHAMPIAVAGYLNKLFGIHQHPVGDKMFSNTDSFVYPTVLSDLYHSLERELISERCIDGKSITSINDNQIMFNDGKIAEFDSMIVTVPFNSFAALYNINVEMPSASLYAYHVVTPSLDFEAADELFVADEMIGFHHVVNIGPDEYIFYSTSDLGNAKAYLGQFTNNRLNIIGQTVIQDGVPRGAPPSLLQYENRKIFMVGRYAQWDWFMDFGSSINRLRRLAFSGAL